MDIETAQLIAESAARAAGAELAAKLSEQFREDFNRFQDSVNGRLHMEFESRFGKMDAAQHIIQHDRLDRLLKLSDSIGRNLFGKIIMGVVIIGLVVAFGGEIVVRKIAGLFG
jgi:hypothetical protein